jgi:hypothetical protein
MSRNETTRLSTRAGTSSKRFSSNGTYQNHRLRSAYTRFADLEIVRPHLPSCSSLPQHWNPIHDRFIAYLATHAPLTPQGHVPRSEELKERWSSGDIAGMVKERFPRFRDEVRYFVILGDDNSSADVCLA